MPELEPIPFGGEYSQVDDNLVPLSSALFAYDCYIDDDAIKGRNGYRSVTPSPLANAGAPQYMGRFRPSSSSVRTVSVIGGGVHVTTDPSSNDNSDGTDTLLGTPFLAASNISGSALGTDFYLGSDSGECLQKIDSSFTLHALCGIPAGAKPSFSLGGPLHWSLFSAADITTSSGCVVNTTISGLASGWLALTQNSSGGDPNAGSSVQFRMPLFNASGSDWVVIGVSPHTQGHDPYPSHLLQISVAVDDGGVPGIWQNIGQTYDTPGWGSPDLFFADLRQLDSNTRANIRWWQFLMDDQFSGMFIVYGYMFLPGKPADPPPFNYYVDFFDPATGVESDLTPVLTVGGVNASFDPLPDCYMNFGEPYNNGGNDTIFENTPARVFNESAPLEMPQAQEIGQIVTITGTAPSFTGFSTVTARLWKDTSSGRRLVITETGVTSGGSYTLTDNGGIGVLANQLYKAGGNAPQMNAMSSHAGRLIAGMENRVYISSFTPTSDTTDPIPQWPAIALEDADGWSFDIYPNHKEQIQLIDGTGDSVYIATQETLYALSDLTPGSLPYLVYRRGALGRRAGGFFEDRFFLAAWDGVYQAANVSSVTEMSVDDRRRYTTFLQPDCNVCMGYQSRKLYVFQDNRYMRYDFVTNRWTAGTVADTVREVVSFTDLI